MVAPESFTSTDVFQGLPWNNYVGTESEPILDWCMQMGWGYKVWSNGNLTISDGSRTQALAPSDWLLLDAKRSRWFTRTAEDMEGDYLWEPPTMIRIHTTYDGEPTWSCEQSLRGCGESCQEDLYDEADVYEDARKHVRIKHMSWEV